MFDNLETDRFDKLMRLLDEIRERNEREQLDTPEKRLEALAQRMTLARDVERAALALSREVA